MVVGIPIGIFFLINGFQSFDGEIENLLIVHLLSVKLHELLEFQALILEFFCQGEGVGGCILQGTSMDLPRFHHF